MWNSRKKKQEKMRKLKKMFDTVSLPIGSVWPPHMLKELEEIKMLDRWWDRQTPRQAWSRLYEVDCQLHEFCGLPPPPPPIGLLVGSE